jgi:polyphosphate kinase
MEREILSMRDTERRHAAADVVAASDLANNLDEFFMIRIATLTRQVRAGVSAISPDGMTIAQQLAAARSRAEHMLSEIAGSWCTARR